jgi:hypothetical protein
MSRQAMEQALGKLVMDVQFRNAFFGDPLEASLAAGIELADRERSALARIRPGALAAFQRYLGGKLIGNWTDGATAWEKLDREQRDPRP